MIEIEKYLRSIMESVNGIRRYPEAAASIDMQIIPYLQDIEENIRQVLDMVEDEDEMLDADLEDDA